MAADVIKNARALSVRGAGRSNWKSAVSENITQIHSKIEGCPWWMRGAAAVPGDSGHHLLMVSSAGSERPS